MSLIAWLGWILGGIGFVVGFAFIPIVAWGFGSSVPKMIAEPISKLLLMVTLVSMGDSALVQTPRGNYELRPLEDIEGEIHEAYLTRWNLVKFGIAFDSCEEAFGDDVAGVDPEGFTPENRFPFDAAEVDVVRAGQGSYIDLTTDGIRIPLGDKLSELRKTANLELATEAISEAMKTYGGDSSQIRQSHSMIMFALFTFVGLGMGWVLAF